ncbi:zinc-binding metallopeptidase family protein [Zavarzinia sp. CC-PAN008]|uniref:zinc-binding metallopeptidase family protein n=1 Tax=Zavarzinia sp. CC-PAN008 TaxID=3243332 RepID=UPI003F744463
MKLFECQSCAQPLYFENTGCESCGHRLGFVPGLMVLSALEPADAPAEGDAPPAELWRALADPDEAARYRFCANALDGVCNWLIPAHYADTHCLSCRHNRTIPDLSLGDNREHWRRLELAKHRLFYTLVKLDLPLPNRIDDPDKGLAFDFLADGDDGVAPKVLTGHDDGLITINLAEADDAERERRRTQMGEPYRTLLGHFRHEIGHFFWDRLVAPDAACLDACRAMFGDEREDYAQALQRHYQNGPVPNWQEHYVSSYAASHPWEDFAETFAHYLHIVDTLETARAFNLRIRPRIAKGDELAAEVDFNPYRAEAATDLIEAWLPLTFAMNSLNRSMGQPDLYPFVLSTPAIDKLGFVHAVVHRRVPVVPQGASSDAVEHAAAVSERLPDAAE